MPSAKPAGQEVMPERVCLEAPSVCQLRCPLCQTGRRESTHTGKGFLRAEHFKDFVRQNPDVKTIELSNDGEIFLNPFLADILKYAHE